MMDTREQLTEPRSDKIRGMFAAIAPIYDLMNSIISLGLHHRWKRRTVQLCCLKPGDSTLDLCTGTGDLVLEHAKRVGSSGHVIGVDFCIPMLDLASKKLCNHSTIQLVVGDALHLPFKDNSFQAATVAFGLRNVADIPLALRELARVVQPGGKVASLDLARPRYQPFKALYHLYFFILVPLIGRLFKNQDAYTYLPNSLRRFPDRVLFARMMEEAGFTSIIVEDQLCGVVAIHVGTVKNS